MKRFFAKFIPRKGSIPTQNQMVHCFGPLNLCPYQIDFGAAYLFHKLQLDTPDSFYEIRDLLSKRAYDGISDANFLARASEIHSNFYQCYSFLDSACNGKVCNYNLFAISFGISEIITGKILLDACSITETVISMQLISRIFM